MVRLSSADSETSRPDPFALPTIAVLAFIVITLVWIAKVGASIEANHNKTGLSAEISLVAQWVIRTGKPTVVRANIAEGLGVANSDIPVRERGFRAEGERLTHVCAVGNGSAFENLVFFSNVNETDGSAMVWQTSNSGAVLSTVVFDGKVVENVPNAQFSAEFRPELKYFQRKARSANFPEDTHIKSHNTGIRSQDPTSHLPPCVPLKLETMVLASSPFVLPAIVLILVASASSGRERR